jgi:hypothetical protein
MPFYKKAKRTEFFYFFSGRSLLPVLAELSFNRVGNTAVQSECHVRHSRIIFIVPELELSSDIRLRKLKCEVRIAKFIIVYSCS